MKKLIVTAVATVVLGLAATPLFAAETGTSDMYKEQMDKGTMKKDEMKSDTVKSKQHYKTKGDQKNGAMGNGDAMKKDSMDRGGTMKNDGMEKKDDMSNDMMKKY